MFPEYGRYNQGTEPVTNKDEIRISPELKKLLHYRRVVQ